MVYNLEFTPSYVKAWYEDRFWIIDVEAFGQYVTYYGKKGNSTLYSRNTGHIENCSFGMDTYMGAGTVINWLAYE